MDRRKQLYKVARGIMSLLEENEMTLFPCKDEGNNIYLYDKEASFCLCMNDMRDSFIVRLLSEEPPEIRNDSKRIAALEGRVPAQQNSEFKFSKEQEILCKQIKLLAESSQNTYEEGLYQFSLAMADIYNALFQR